MIRDALDMVTGDLKVAPPNLTVLSDRPFKYKFLDYVLLFFSYLAGPALVALRISFADPFIRKLLNKIDASGRDIAGLLEYSDPSMEGSWHRAEAESTFDFVDATRRD
ncbi:MAG: hypothetical protein AAB335_02555, partial [candidate division NC10 bacterium]